MAAPRLSTWGPGFDAVGIGDVDGDRLGDLLLSAADGQTVDVVAGGRVP